MTKEQIQAELTAATAEADTAKKQVASLETENGRLRSQIEATAGANKIPEGDLNKARAEHLQAQEKIAELEKKIEADAKEYQAGQDSANAQIADLERDRDEWKAMYEGAKEMLQQPQAKESAVDTFVQTMKTQIETLTEVINDSCADHCPHHANPEACRNCGIFKRLQAAGITIAPKKTEE